MIKLYTNKNRQMFSMQSIVFASLALFFLSACGNKTPPAPAAPPPVKVTVQPVRQENAMYYDEYPATVTPLNQVELRPQVSGFISSMHFSDGQRVKKGQLLY